MPYPHVDSQDAFPKPPEALSGMPRKFSPLVKIAMRMGWVEKAYAEPNPMSKFVEDVIEPFSYIAAHEDKEEDKVYVFIVLRGQALSFVEQKTLFPTDAFIGRLKTLS